LLLTSGAFFIAALDLLVVITALPAIHYQLQAGAGMLQWIVNAYSLAAAAGIITAAALGDRFGRRRLFALGLAIFTLGSAACALAPNVETLIGARAVQGLGAAIIAPMSLTILTSAFPPERRGTVVGIWGGLAGLAVAVGPVVGGAVTQSLSWHWIFWINVPIGLAAAVLSSFKLAESRGPATALDLPGVAFISVGALGVVWGLMQAGETGLAEPRAASTLLAGVAAIAAFLLWERNAKAPMLPLRLFRSRTFVAANLTAFFMNAALLAGASLISQYLQFGLGFAPLVAGVHYLPMTATPILVAPLAGMLSDRIGPRPVMVAGMVLLAVGLGWVALVAGPDLGYGGMVVPLLIAGAGVSMPFATAATASLSAVSPADIGKASGATNTIQRFGGAFGLAVATAVFTASGQLTSPTAFAAGFRPAELTAAFLAILGALAAVWVAGKRPAAAPAPLKPARTAALAK
jgi:EmrB/QacA subfamily drug resistance transporter